MGLPLPATLFITAALCGQGYAVFSPTLLPILKICAVLFISDVPFIIPSSSRDSVKFICLFCIWTNTGWAEQFPVLTTHLQGLKNLVSKIDCNFVHDIWLEGWWHFLHFSGSPTFEINHACLEICHQKQMQNWRSQFVFRVAGYFPIWRVEIIH